MKRLYVNLPILFTCLISLFIFGSAAAQETVVNVQGQPMIVTAVPAPKQIVVIPQGYINCFTVPAGWNYNNIWIAEHKVCQYTPNTAAANPGVAWVDGYWACTKYINAANPKQGECTNWEWEAGHWVKTLEVY